MPPYSDTLIVLTLLISMVILQSIIATVAHRKQKSYIPGVVDAQLDHHSFVFRSNRTFLNSLENVPIFILSVLLAMQIGASSDLVFWGSVLFALARLAHMILFYKVATNANPSPRSYFYTIGLIGQLYLLGVCFNALL